MAIIKPNRLKDAQFTISDAAPSRIIPVGLRLDLGGLNPANGDIIQLTPNFFDGNAVSSVSVLRLSVAVDSAVLANGDKIVLCNQVKTGTPTAQMDLFSAGDATAQNQMELEKALDGGKALQFRIWPGPFFIGLEYNSDHAAIANGKIAQVVMAFARIDNAPTEVFS